MFMIGMFSFLFFRFHYIMLLLSIEIMMLSIYFYFSYMTYFGLGSLGVLMFFLIMMVCGAGFGICLLVFYVRKGGVENFSSIF
uniref:NADH-ubiquinone oxidoreductase chain 4L n=1 Tax=Sperchon plumifer TaxID=2047715 RepID=A0A3G1VW78_9ACAR|nr:NADH dehydrogenase subunit 4L [Sperchon plumifer]AYK28785.1 NADH dehydrogenase subunit 4L [Sperchon plumifer]